MKLHRQPRVVVAHQGMLALLLTLCVLVTPEVGLSTDVRGSKHNGAKQKLDTSVSGCVDVEYWAEVWAECEAKSQTQAKFPSVSVCNFARACLTEQSHAFVSQTAKAASVDASMRFVGSEDSAHRSASGSSQLPDHFKCTHVELAPTSHPTPSSLQACARACAAAGPKCFGAQVEGGKCHFCTSGEVIAASEQEDVHVELKFDASSFTEDEPGNTCTSKTPVAEGNANLRACQDVCLASEGCKGFVYYVKEGRGRLCWTCESASPFARGTNVLGCESDGKEIPCCTMFRRSGQDEGVDKLSPPPPPETGETKDPQSSETSTIPGHRALERRQSIALPAGQPAEVERAQTDITAATQERGRQDRRGSILPSPELS